MKKSTLVLAFSGAMQLASHAQWSQENLSGYRWQMGSTVIGPKVFYAGGDIDDCLSVVDIFDSGTGQTTTTAMSVDRRSANVTNSGSRVLIAGGVNDLAEVTDVVDIYDTTDQAWTVGQLSLARYGMSAVSNGSVALFAGGTAFPPPDSSYSRVDIYNGGTGLWTTAELSEARGLMGAVVAGDRAFFAGGFPDGGGASDRVDIYDFAAGTWSTATLSVARWGLAAATAGSKVLFAGGQNSAGVGLDRVDIYDLNTGTWSTASLSVGRCFSPGEYAASTCGKAVFVGGALVDESTGQLTEDYSEIDVYDATTGEWSTGQLPYGLIACSASAVGDRLLVAGGGTMADPNIQLYDIIRIWEDGCTVGMNEVVGSGPQVTIFPNPAFEEVTVVLEGARPANYRLFDAAGRVVLQGRLSGERSTLPTSQLHLGVYVLRVEHQGVYINEQVILQ